MKFLKKLLLAILVIIAIILVVAVFLPSKKHIEDSITINTPAKAVFEQVVRLNNWEKWSPFSENDTAMVTTYENLEKAVGSIMKWESEKQGNGSMTIVEVDELKSIKMSLLFEGMKESITTWTFVEENGNTKVTWTLDLDGLRWPDGRLMGMFMTPALHKSFQKGLANLKIVAEEYQKMISYFKVGEIKVKEVPERIAVYVTDSATCEQVSDVLGKSYGMVMGYLGPMNIECDGPPFARWLMWNDTLNKFVVQAGMFVKSKVEPKAPVQVSVMPKQKVVAAIHYGPYETSVKTYEAIEKYIKDNKLTANGAPWEVYVTDPEKEPDMTKWETEICYPVK